MVDFPNLTASDYTWESQDTGEYNCIAWAVGDNTRWWEPHEDAYWPPGISYEFTPAALCELFQGLNYNICDNADLEDGFEKIAIYAHSDTQATHAARQLDNGAWASKLGEDIDIHHASLKCLEGPCYGRVFVFMKRPKS